MKLLTKKNCSACETVKKFIEDANILDIQILDCTNDMVYRQKMGDAGVMTFPALEKPDGTFIYPSIQICEFLGERENSKASNN